MVLYLYVFGYLKWESKRVIEYNSKFMTYKSCFVTIRNCIYDLMKSKAEMSPLLMMVEEDRTGVIKSIEFKKNITLRNAELYIEDTCIQQNLSFCNK